MTGIVETIVNHGSIVEVVLRIEDARRSYPESVYFDHRPFSHLYEGEGGDLIGREMTVYGDRYEGQTVEMS